MPSQAGRHTPPSGWLQVHETHAVPEALQISLPTKRPQEQSCWSLGRQITGAGAHAPNIATTTATKAHAHRICVITTCALDRATPAGTDNVCTCRR